MPRKQAAYRSTPTNPNIPAGPQGRESAIEDLDDFFDELDQCLEEVDVLRSYIQRPGE
jgi:hypothetical protein